MDQGTVIFIGLIVIGAGYFIWILKQRQEASVKQEQEAALLQVAARCIDEFIDRGVQVKLRFDEAPNLELEQGEELIFVLPNTSFFEPRAIRTWRSAYGGPTIRLAKGLSFHIGQSRGASESHEELRVIDRGALVLTNRRLLFIGSRRTVAVPLQSIIDIESYTDGLRVHRQRKQKPELFIFGTDDEIKIVAHERTVSAPLDGRLIIAIVQQAISLQARKAVGSTSPPAQA